MSLRRRLLRIALTVLVILVFAGYFAFSTLLFSPIEDDYEFELATLLPRDVDFMLAKADLAADFSDFPELKLASMLAENKAGAEFLASPMWTRFKAERGIDEALANVESGLAEAPIAIDPLDAFGGREVLVAGYFRGADLAAADVVVMARTNWMGKLAESMLSFPGLAGIEGQGLAVIEDGGVYSLSGGGLERPVHVARIRDVLLAGTSRELVAGALELEAKKGEDSFGLSARYGDYILGVPNREAEDLELFIDHDALMANLGLDGNVPDLGSQDFTPAFMAHLFQEKLLKEVEGVVGFEGGVSLNLHADLSSEKLTGAQKRFYRQAGFNRDRIMSVARYAPMDTGILAYLQAPIGDVLRMILDSTEPALQDNFNDLVRAVWGYPDGTALLDELDAGLKDRLALIVRPNTYPDEGAEGPPHDDQPAFAWAVVGWSKDKSILEDFRSKVIANQGRFGIQGRGSGTSGVFNHTISEGGGFLVKEYWSPLVPGTGHMASVMSDEIFIVGNHHLLLGDILLTSLGHPDHPPLADNPRFLSLVNLGLDSTNGLLWFNPEPLSETLHEMANAAARDAVAINWDVERPRIDQLVRKRDFGSKAPEAMDPDEYSRYERVLEEELTRFESQFFGEHVSGLAEEYNRRMDYLDELRGALLQLSLDPKRVDISLRAFLPLEPESP